MAMPDAVREKMRETTRNAAAAFIEDLAVIRKLLLGSNQNRTELRLMSNILRRLLIDDGGDLRRIAPPRIGRLMIRTMDDKSYVARSIKSPFMFFINGGAEIIGVFTRHACHPVPIPHTLNPSDAQIELSHDGFLSQKVACFNGSWFSRREVIKYIANTASGVHSGTPSDPKDQALYDLSLTLQFEPSSYIEKDDAVGVIIAPTASDRARIAKEYKPERIDCVLYELLCAGYYLENSPDILKLEAEIRSELGLPPA